MVNDLRNVVNKEMRRFPFIENLSAYEGLKFLGSKIMEQGFFFPGSGEMHNRYECDIHPGESLSPLKYWVDPNNWYLYGSCRHNPEYKKQISHAPNSFSLEWG